jgi:hypothetical protein
MSAAWFHVPSLPDAGIVWIPKDEAKHALGARRLGPGDAVTLFDGKRERLTLNASFSGALLLPFYLSSNVLIARCFRCSTPRPLFRSPRLVCMCFQIYPWNCVHTLCWCSWWIKA